MSKKIEVDKNSIATWRAFMQAYQKVTPRLECNMQETEGLPLTWYDVLAQLNHTPNGGLRLQDLAEAIALSQSGLTRLLDRMAEAGLVERMPCAHDRRGTFAIITPAGRSALNQATPVYIQSIEAHFVQHLNAEEVQTLHKILAKILAPKA